VTDVDWAGAVVALHDFFTRWFASPPTEGGFERFEAGLGPEFTIVTPDGSELSRGEIIEAVRSMHGTGGPDISIRDVRVVHLTGTFATVRYVEVQDWEDGRHTERVSTAVLEADATAPDGVRWHSVHETWLPGESP
jgi:hypothetical protein